MDVRAVDPPKMVGAALVSVSLGKSFFLRSLLEDSSKSNLNEDPFTGESSINEDEAGASEKRSTSSSPATDEGTLGDGGGSEDRRRRFSLTGEGDTASPRNRLRARDIGLGSLGVIADLENNGWDFPRGVGDGGSGDASGE